MTTFLNLLKALPEIIALLKEIQKRIDEQQTEKKIKDEVKIIHQAFLLKDASRLQNLFNSK